MQPYMWAIVIVVIIVVVAAAWLLNKQRSSAKLKETFGPEYQREVDRTEGTRQAEKALKDRAERRAGLEIQPLSEESRSRYADSWRGVQSEFVDAPEQAVQHAHSLLHAVMRERGYPENDLDQQAEMVSVDHPYAVDDYRTARDLHQRSVEGGASTEDLRGALVRYRALFDDLLAPEGRTHAPGSR